MKSKFLSISIGVATMLLATGFLIRSANTAYAAPSPSLFLEQGTSQIGKYQACYEKGTTLILDTETGEAIFYKKSESTKWEWKKMGSQIPKNPFGY